MPIPGLTGRQLMGVTIGTGLVATTVRDGFGAFDDQLATGQALAARIVAKSTGWPRCQEMAAGPFVGAFVNWPEAPARGLQGPVTAQRARHARRRKVTARFL